MSVDDQPVVLIIDDDPVQRTLLHEALSLAGSICDTVCKNNESERGQKFHDGIFHVAGLSVRTVP